MKKLILLFIATTLSGFIYAQCNPAIPNNSLIVSSNSTLSGSNVENVWICDNTTVTDSAGADTIFMEENSSLYCQIGHVTVYAKPGCYVELNDSNITVHKDTGATVNDVVGTTNTINGCVGIVYDYTNAPSNGCITTNVKEEKKCLTDLKVYHNPIKIGNSIQLQCADRIEAIRVVDTQGKQVKTLKGLNKNTILIDTDGWNAGIYIIEITDKTGSKRSIKQVLQ